MTCSVPVRFCLCTREWSWAKVTVTSKVLCGSGLAQRSLALLSVTSVIWMSWVFAAGQNQKGHQAVNEEGKISRKKCLSAAESSFHGKSKPSWDLAVSDATAGEALFSIDQIISPSGLFIFNNLLQSNKSKPFFFLTRFSQLEIPSTFPTTVNVPSQILL